MLLDNLGVVLFYQDRAQLQYHFAKLGEKGWEGLLDDQPASELSRRAWIKFTQQYGLQSGRPGITPEAAREYLAAQRACRVPDWVLAIAPLAEIRKAGE